MGYCHGRFGAQVYYIKYIGTDNIIEWLSVMKSVLYADIE